jgi:hypothetical protein
MPWSGSFQEEVALNTLEGELVIMASNITLSAGVRQNLLSLQSTADLMSTTQNRLATGKKVNSALDNPTNFFTAQSLQSRAGDMSSLLDGMTSGVKTLEAADNGLSAITKTVESMQSTLRQARQDKSFKTGSYDLALPTSVVGNEVLTLSGGALTGTQTVDLTKTGPATAATAGVKTNGAFATIDFNPAGATPAVVSGGAFSAVNLNNVAVGPQAGTVTAGAYSAVDLSGANTLTLSIGVDGGGTQNITIDNTITAVDNTAVTGAELATAISGQLTGATATFNGTNLVFTSSTTGATSEIDITAVGGTAAGASGIAVANDLGAAAVIADSISFTLDVDGTSQAITLDNSITAVNKAAVTAAELVTAINTQFGSNVASVGTGGNIEFTSPSTGTGANVDITGFATTGVSTTSGIANASDAGGAAGAARVMSFTLQRDAETAVNISLDITDAGVGGIMDAAEMAAAINTDFGSNVASVVGGNIVFTSTTTGTASNMTVGAITTNTVSSGGLTAGAGTAGQAAGPPAGEVAMTVDEVVAAVNADVDLKGKVRASNDGGKLRIENISTAELTVGGLNTAGTGVIGSGVGEGEIGGNTVRTNLVKQFNELRDQLDKLADDASYNGVNLLRGDLLKLTFNETGTSTIEIQAKDEDGAERAINSTTLGIDTATDADFDSDTGIDGILNGMKDALGVLRSQSSSFGSNLSIVQNRTEFTKSMINTLQTGADSLVLADTNEEAANMLALQTRQQLSSTALSLASQADQAVLRLF